MFLAILTREIESPAFAAHLGFASGKKVFLDALAGDPIVAKLTRSLRARPNAAGKVLRRIKELARQQVDPRYENPLDSAIAVYVWCLDQLDRGIARIGAEFALGATQIWWAREMSNIVLQSELRSTGTANATITPARATAGWSSGALPLIRPVLANDLVLISRLLLKTRKFTLATTVSPRQVRPIETRSESKLGNLKAPPAFIVSTVTTSDQRTHWRR